LAGAHVAAEDLLAPTRARRERQLELGVDPDHAGRRREALHLLGVDARRLGPADEEPEEPRILRLRRLQLDLIDREHLAEEHRPHPEAEREEEDQRGGAGGDAEAARRERAARAPE